MDFAGYTYRLLQEPSEDEARKAIQESIDGDRPVLAYQLVNNDWCLVGGYDSDRDTGRDTLFGCCVSESWDDPHRKPDTLEDGVFSKTHWFHNELKICLVTGKKTPRKDYAELFHYLKANLQQPDHMLGISGLPAFDACKSVLLDDDRYDSTDQARLAELYRSVHAFIGVLAESRCFAAFAFWAGFFGRIIDEATLARMKEIGSSFMDTHNQCWGAWAAMGHDHRCQPELYLHQFVTRETREKLAGYVDLFKANDEKAIYVLEDIYAGSAFNSG